MIAHLPDGPERVLRTIEHWFSQVSAEAIYDRDLSLDILAHLLPLLDTPLDETLPALEQYFQSHWSLLTHTVRHYADDPSLRYALLAQPEGLVLLYLLDHDAFTLRECWARRYPLAFLEALADVWGHPDTDI